MSKKRKNYTDYTKPQVDPVEEVPVEEMADEVVVEEPAVETDEPDGVYGTVVDRERLNVRTAPNALAIVVTTLAVGTEVMIDEVASTADFYKIFTGSGIEGYCMKQFIKID